MKTKKARPYNVYGVSATSGVRRKLDLESMTVEVSPGIEVEIKFSASGLGELVMLCPPSAEMRSRYDAGFADSFVVVFGAANVLHVMVETQRRKVQGRNQDGASRRKKKASQKGSG